MRKIIVLCSALVFGLCTESSAWLVDFDEIDAGTETFTPKLSLVAVQERMTRLQTVSGDSGTAERVFRQLYNNWFSNGTKWTGQGKSSTINNIQGYCSSKATVLTEFEKVLKDIEKRITDATATSSTEVEDAKSTIEIQNNTTKATKDGTIEAAVLNLEVTNETTEATRSETVRTTILEEELPIDTSDTRKKNKKIQRGLLEQATDTMEGTLYDDSPDITAGFPSFELTSLAGIFGEAGVDVDEDFIVSLKRAWSMQALNMSDNAIDARVGAEEGENGPTRTYQLVDPNIFSNSDIATFLLDHFARTDTGSDSADVTWDLSSKDPKIRDLLKYGRDNIKLTDENVSKDIRDSLMRIFDVEYEGDDDDTKYQELTNLGIEKNGKEFKTFKNMKFHLNLVARMLQEINQERDETSNADDSAYEVDSIVFHAFRQYMTQAFREALFLIKVSEEIEERRTSAPADHP